MPIETLAIGSCGFRGDDALSLAGLESVAGVIKPGAKSAENGSINWSLPKVPRNDATLIKKKIPLLEIQKCCLKKE